MPLIVPPSEATPDRTDGEYYQPMRALRIRIAARKRGIQLRRPALFVALDVPVDHQRIYPQGHGPSEVSPKCE